MHDAPGGRGAAATAPPPARRRPERRGGRQYLYDVFPASVGATVRLGGCAARLAGRLGWSGTTFAADGRGERRRNGAETAFGLGTATALGTGGWSLESPIVTSHRAGFAGSSPSTTTSRRGDATSRREARRRPPPRPANRFGNGVGQASAIEAGPTSFQSVLQVVRAATAAPKSKLARQPPPPHPAHGRGVMPLSRPFRARPRGFSPRRSAAKGVRAPALDASRAALATGARDPRFPNL